MIEVYLAGPLFSEAERNWHMETKKRIEELGMTSGGKFRVTWPYELIKENEINDLEGKACFEIFSRCRSALDKAEILIALLDGSQVDDGTSWEIGYFFGKGKESGTIIGVRTDFRKCGDTKYSMVNSMIESSCDRLVTSTWELIKVLSELYL